MKRIGRTLCCLSGLFLLAACEDGAGGAGHVAAKAGWLGDLDEAMKEAKASNKPILIDFGAEW